MKDKNDGIYKHSMNMTPEEKDISMYIDNNIHYIPSKKETRFGLIISKPRIQDYSKISNIKVLFTGPVIENFMGFSTQVAMKIKWFTEKEIKHPFEHTIIEVPENKEIFNLNQTEYNIYYCLNKFINHGTEDNSSFLYVYEVLKNKIKNGTFTNFRVKKEVDLNKILNMCNKEVLIKWKSLKTIDINLFQEMDEESKIYYYLYWSKDNSYSIYKKFNNRFYGQSEQLNKEELIKVQDFFTSKNS